METKLEKINITCLNGEFLCIKKYCNNKEKFIRIFEKNGEEIVSYKENKENKIPELKTVSHYDYINSDKKFNYSLYEYSKPMTDYKVRGFLLANKKYIRTIHTSFQKNLNRVLEWTEDFIIKSMDENHIITEANENGEYYDLDWDKNVFYALDKEGILATCTSK